MIDRLNSNASHIWGQLQIIYPALVAFELPQLRVSKRLKVTAGQAFRETRIVEISNTFLTSAYRFTMVTILPHELIHIADYDLNGYNELPCGHGKAWCDMMLAYGLKPDKYGVRL